MRTVIAAFTVFAAVLILALIPTDVLADPPPTEFHGKFIFVSDSTEGPWFARGVFFSAKDLTPANSWSGSAFTWGADGIVFGGFVTFRPGGGGLNTTELQLCASSTNCHSELYMTPGVFQWNPERSAQTHCWYSNNPSNACILYVSATESMVKIQNLGFQPGFTVLPMPRTMTKDSDQWGSAMIGSEVATIANDGGAMKRYNKVVVNADQVTGIAGQVLPEAYTLKIVDAPELFGGLAVSPGKKAGVYIGGQVHTDGLKLIDPGALPVCNAASRGLLRYEEGAAGVADALFVCMKDAAGAFAWTLK
mgnify:CR=1 FL=1